jgi:hypothetical protein
MWPDAVLDTRLLLLLVLLRWVPVMLLVLLRWRLR